jgi:hypothetical protein
MIFDKTQNRDRADCAGFGFLKLAQVRTSRFSQAVYLLHEYGHITQRFANDTGLPYQSMGFTTTVMNACFGLDATAPTPPRP